MSKICMNCGASCQDHETFCQTCGAKLPETQTGRQNTWQNVGAQQPYGGAAGRQNMYGQNPGSQNTYNQNANPYGTPAYGMGQGQKMGWFKFIIYFQLFASAVINAALGITAFTGSHYDGKAELVYAFFPGMSAVDKVYGLVLIVLAVFAIIVRFQLAQFKKAGPNLYLLLMLISAVAGLVYIIAVNINISGYGVNVEYSDQISQLVVCVVLLVVNYIYFQKRSHLFVN